MQGQLVAMLHPRACYCQCIVAHAIQIMMIDSGCLLLQRGVQRAPACFRPGRQSTLSFHDAMNLEKLALFSSAIHLGAHAQATPAKAAHLSEV